MHRTHTCNELTKENIGEKVTLSGWVSNRRDHGGIIFIDLRDRYGLTQIVFDPADNKESWETADKFRSEYVIKATGTVRSRPEGQDNPNMTTGEIEVIINSSVELLSSAKTTPFELDEHSKETNEELRLKYRYLDMRRKKILDYMKFRSSLTTYTRNWFTVRDFIDVQTPILANSSPEGARDFLVPSRLHPGTFYALPQAPQQFKQLLMVGGVDKYFQIAPCFRDEDPRADRHAGDFYQIDCEMSFVEQDDVFKVVEDFLVDITSELTDKKILTETAGKDNIRETGKFFKLTHEQAMEKYGSDKPDLRYGLEMVDVIDIFEKSTNEIFSSIASDKVNNRIKALRVPNGDNIFSKTQMKGFEDYVRKFGAKGLGYFQMKEDGLKGPLNKFFTEADLTELVEVTKLEVGDVVFFGAGEKKLVQTYMGKFRNYLAEMMQLANPKEIAFCWIVDFPIFEEDEVTGKIDFEHNPFSMPQGGAADFDKEGTDLLSVKGFQYDLACNGYEILSGAIRNHDVNSLVKAFEKVGRTKQEVMDKFGAMYEAFQYGVPPHGGFAIGFDRLMMIYLNEHNIRDIYAFPKSGNAMDLMMNSPTKVDNEQLAELNIEVVEDVQ
ncbi:MAG: aspartate--tRNA ligase [Candidatus Gracilibacteria bacterium]|nr:aspartate--tRNA ligase [Candidatus Gracilibacteria bacterium]